jgi:hypothetical protein
MCSHQPTCPPVTAGIDRPLGVPLAARIVADHPEQGWSLLCNGVVRFSDGGALLPDGTSIPAVRPEPTPVATRPARSVAIAA